MQGSLFVKNRTFHPISRCSACSVKILGKNIGPMSIRANGDVILRCGVFAAIPGLMLAGAHQQFHVRICFRSGLSHTHIDNEPCQVTNVHDVSSDRLQYCSSECQRLDWLAKLATLMIGGHAPWSFPIEMRASYRDPSGGPTLLIHLVMINTLLTRLCGYITL